MQVILLVLDSISNIAAYNDLFAAWNSSLGNIRSLIVPGENTTSIPGVDGRLVRRKC
jgi:hypothetical protein